jgi:cytochrome c oxidase subunit 2
MTKNGHAVRIALIWLALSAITMVLVAVFLAPHLPPGKASTEASGQTLDNEVLTRVSVPIIALIFVYFGYVLVAFRARDASAQVDGPPIRGNMRVQTIWVVVTTLTVLGLAAFGTYELLGGSGGGQGPKPAFVPSAPVSAAGVEDPPLQVQVIAQQWQFTYRFPEEGGFETAHLELPVGQQVELHVTSLDATHSFWALGLGVKADANPGVDNIAYVTPKHTGTFDIHCAELCGLFHGYMFDTGQVVSAGDFAAWIRAQRAFMTPVSKYLPPYSTSYLPEPDIRGG